MSTQTYADAFRWNHSNCKATPNDPIDCFTDLCNDCCNKGKVGDTFAVPPGFYPMVCYPGTHFIILLPSISHIRS